MQVYRYGALHIGGGRRKEALNDLSISIISSYERVMAAGCKVYMMILYTCSSSSFGKTSFSLV